MLTTALVSALIGFMVGYLVGHYVGCGCGCRVRPKDYSAVLHESRICVYCLGNADHYGKCLNDDCLGAEYSYEDPDGWPHLKGKMRARGDGAAV